MRTRSASVAGRSRSLLIAPYNSALFGEAGCGCPCNVGLHSVVPRGRSPRTCLTSRMLRYRPPWFLLSRLEEAGHRLGSLASSSMRRRSDCVSCSTAIISVVPNLRHADNIQQVCRRDARHLFLGEFQRSLAFSALACFMFKPPPAVHDI